MSNNQIENILRRAPQPRPPGTLAQRLKAQALNAPRAVALTPNIARGTGSFLSRWWAALAPAAVSLACAAGLIVQHLEITKLKNADVQAPEQITPSPTSQVNSSGPSPTATPPHPGTSQSQQELSRLRGAAAQLRAEVSRLEKIRGDNEKARAQLASGAAGVFTADEVAALELARDRAWRIQCVNNLKQIALAVKVWSLDNNSMTPPNMLSMSNELGSFKILVCPADTGRQAANDSGSFSQANCSYDYTGASSSVDAEPNRILLRCPLHGNIALFDGSVQSSIGKEHPDWIIKLDGKYYFRAQPATPPATTPTSDAPGQNQ
jgi:hypothetical protein